MGRASVPSCSVSDPPARGSGPFLPSLETCLELWILPCTLLGWSTRKQHFPPPPRN